MYTFFHSRENDEYADRSDEEEGEYNYNQRVEKKEKQDREKLISSQFKLRKGVSASFLSLPFFFFRIPSLSLSSLGLLSSTGFTQGADKL